MKRGGEYDGSGHVDFRFYRGDLMIGANANGDYELANGTPYAIGVFNTDARRRADVRIVIDGKWIGLFRARPMDEMIIERPIASARPLTFFSNDSFGGRAVGTTSDERDAATGRVEITVTFEDMIASTDPHETRFGPMTPVDDPQRLDADTDVGVSRQRFEAAERMPVDPATILTKTYHLLVSET
jgi:hypothetical protein